MAQDKKNDSKSLNNNSLSQLMRAIDALEKLHIKPQNRGMFSSEPNSDKIRAAVEHIVFESKGAVEGRDKDKLLASESKELQGSITAFKEAYQKLTPEEILEAFKQQYVSLGSVKMYLSDAILSQRQKGIKPAGQ
jgi:hypothetical protein